jgi:regulator of protease activity HflC (stomatin/prohibitin superfamily)
MFSKLRIRKHEVGLWFRHGDFKGLLEPGAYVLPGRYFGTDSVQVVDKLTGKFEHKLLDVLIDHVEVAEQTIRVELADDERALVWKDGRLGWILGAGRHVFWKGPAKIEVQAYNVNDFVFTHPKIDSVLAFPNASRYFDGVSVEPGETVLLYRDGKLVHELGPGLFVNWKGAGRVERKIVDLREQVLDVCGQEIMSADKLTLRVNMLVNYRVIDARQAAESVANYEQALYREAQLALREAIGGRALDKLLVDKEQLGSEVRNALAERAGEFGLKVLGVGLRDVILPGEMKSILNEVILAQKQAEANLIRRREETAAARSQANTAKLLAENPALTRMKELEALQEILRGTKATFVFGQGEMLDQVRKLTGDAEMQTGAD